MHLCAGLTEADVNPGSRPVSPCRALRVQHPNYHVCCCLACAPCTLLSLLRTCAITHMTRPARACTAGRAAAASAAAVAAATRCNSGSV